LALEQESSPQVLFQQGQVEPQRDEAAQEQLEQAAAARQPAGRQAPLLRASCGLPERPLPSLPYLPRLFVRLRLPPQLAAGSERALFPQPQDQSNWSASSSRLRQPQANNQ
jgi:hypothetical protein